MTMENTISDAVFSDWSEKLITQFLLCREIIQVFHLLEAIKKIFPDRNNGEFLVLLDHVAYDYIVVNWAKIFGSREEDLHFQKVFQYNFYQADLVKTKFLEKLSISDAEYAQMHTALLAWRNKIIAHFDFDDAYGITHNEDFFQKIPIQCQSLQESIIFAFRTAGNIYPNQGVYVSEIKKNKKFSDIANELSRSFRLLPSDITEKTIVEMFDIYKQHKLSL